MLTRPLVLVLTAVVLAASAPSQALAAGWRGASPESKQYRIDKLREDAARKKATYVKARNRADKLMFAKLFFLFETPEEKEAIARRYDKYKARKDEAWLDYQEAKIALKRAMKE